MAAEQSPSRRHEAASANPRAGVGRAVPRTCVGRDATARGWVDRGAIRCVPGECKDHPVEAVCGGPTARLDKSEAMGCRRRGLTCLAGGGQRGPASQGDTEHCLHGRAASLLRFLGCGSRCVGGDDFVCEATLGGVTASPRYVCVAWEMMIHNRLESQSLMTRIGILLLSPTDPTHPRVRAPPPSYTCV